MEKKKGGGGEEAQIVSPIGVLHFRPLVSLEISNIRIQVLYNLKKLKEKCVVRLFP